MMNKTIFCTAAAPAFALAACAPDAEQTETSKANIAAPPAQDAFFAALSSHCGKAYAGQLVSDDPADADFLGAAMVMHVRECSDTQIAVPFHVQQAGEWDRSRTWLITRTENGLRLKHDHRHKDGKDDAVTMYGGDTADAGSASAQDFPVDGFSVEMFKREGLSASVTNVWTVEVDPVGAERAQFAYQLRRTQAGGAPEDRLFRVEFDLSQPVDAPPAPWGWDAQ